VAFPIGAFVTGLIARPERGFHPARGFLAAVVGGIVVVYAVGVPVLAWRAGLDFSTALRTGAAIFLPGDLIKAVLATVVAAGVHRAYPALRPDDRREAAATRT
jgi:biotin transport system substrate-specific component